MRDLLNLFGEVYSCQYHESLNNRASRLIENWYELLIIPLITHNTQAVITTINYFTGTRLTLSTACNSFENWVPEST